MNITGPEEITKQLELFADLRARDRALQLTAQALIERLHIQESALVTLSLNSHPARNTREAVEAFVRAESMALSAAEIGRAFSVLEQRLTERLGDLFGS